MVRFYLVQKFLSKICNLVKLYLRIPKISLIFTWDKWKYKKTFKMTSTLLPELLPTESQNTDIALKLCTLVAGTQLYNIKLQRLIVLTQNFDFTGIFSKNPSFYFWVAKIENAELPFTYVLERPRWRLSQHFICVWLQSCTF